MPFEFLTGHLRDILGAIDIDAGTGRHTVMVSDEANTRDSDVTLTDTPTGNEPVDASS